jgi:hypothetical protein
LEILLDINSNLRQNTLITFSFALWIRTILTGIRVNSPSRVNVSKFRVHNLTPSNFQIFFKVLGYESGNLEYFTQIPVGIAPSPIGRYLLLCFRLGG